MSDQPLPTPPPNPSEQLLRQKFTERFVTQSERMDKLAAQLITLELAIPGIYATILKLTLGEAATLTLDGWLIATFTCWLIALLLTIISLIPRQRKVDPTLLKSNPAERSPILSIEDYFFQAAQHKRRLLIAATLLFFSGIICATVALF